MNSMPSSSDRDANLAAQGRDDCAPKLNHLLSKIGGTWWIARAQAEAELDALLAENERLREALIPFAEFADVALDPESPEGEFRWLVPGEQMQTVTVWFGPSDFGNARAVLAAEENTDA